MGQIIQRVTTVVIVLMFFTMPFVLISVKTVGLDIPTVAISMSALDLSNGFSIKPFGFPIYLIDWSAPNGIVWLLILPAVYGWFALDVQKETRRRELGISAILTVISLVIMIAIAFNISSANAKIEDAILRDGNGLSDIGLGFLFQALNNNKTRLTIELSYGWWYAIIAYVLMGLNLLRELTAAGSQIVQEARGSLANVASGISSALNQGSQVQGVPTQPIPGSGISAAQTLEQKLDRYMSRVLFLMPNMIRHASSI
jgi:hypothetical protein